MNEEEIKKIAKEEFMNNVMKQLDSALIFTYIQNLENQLQQKENIIKEVREKLEYLLTHDKVEINGRIYIKQEADDFITNYILEILDKVKE